MTNSAMRRLLQEKKRNAQPRPLTAPASIAVPTTRRGGELLTSGLPPSVPPAPQDSSSVASLVDPDAASLDNAAQPKATSSFKEGYLRHSRIPKAYELARIQKFGKDNLDLTYTSEATFPHTLLILYKGNWIPPEDRRNLWQAWQPAKRLWQEWHRVKDINFWPLRDPYLGWKTQKKFDKRRLNMRTACLFHYDLDLAAVMRFIGGNHVNEHLDPDPILARVHDLVSPETYRHLERILKSGCPAKYNDHGTAAQFKQYREYGNHKSLTRAEKSVYKTMNKEDAQDHVLTFKDWLADFIPHLMVAPQGFLQKPG
jgi:hypothetical protein